MYEKQILSSVQGLWIKDTISETKSVGATQTIAELLGVTLGNDVIAVTVYVPSGTVNYNPAGAADATNGVLPNSPYTVFGKTEIDTAEFFASTVNMTIIVHERRADISGIG